MLLSPPNGGSSRLGVIHKRNNFPKLAALRLFGRFAAALDNDVSKPMLGKHLPQTCFDLAPDGVCIRRRRHLQT